MNIQDRPSIDGKQKMGVQEKGKKRKRQYMVQDKKEVRDNDTQVETEDYRLWFY